MSRITTVQELVDALSTLKDNAETGNHQANELAVTHEDLARKFAESQGQATRVRRTLGTPEGAPAAASVANDLDDPSGSPDGRAVLEQLQNAITDLRAANAKLQTALHELKGATESTRPEAQEKVNAAGQAVADAYRLAKGRAEATVTWYGVMAEVHGGIGAVIRHYRDAIVDQIRRVAHESSEHVDGVPQTATLKAAGPKVANVLRVATREAATAREREEDLADEGSRLFGQLAKRSSGTSVRSDEDEHELTQLRTTVCELIDELVAIVDSALTDDLAAASTRSASGVRSAAVRQPAAATTSRVRPAGRPTP